MYHHYRVTKYDPAFRDVDGSFRRAEWTAYTDIGREFDGRPLLESEYLCVETAYLFTIQTFLREASVASLILRELEVRNAADLPAFVRPGSNLNIAECAEFARLALREQAWAKLVKPGKAFVHFGYDYYMYIGVPRPCPNATSETQRRGLFVEQVRSPYLRSRPKRAVDSSIPRHH